MFLYSIDEIQQNTKLCIYGKGSRALGFKNLIVSSRKDIKIVDTIDSSSLESFLADKKDYDLIIIASAYWKEIKENLDKHHLGNFKIIGDALMYIEQENNKETKTDNSFSPKFQNALDVFKNEEHKELYTLLYECQANKKPLSEITKYWQKELNEQEDSQYFDFIVKDKIKTIIDAGVYDGATIGKFIEECSHLKNVFGFEPLMNEFDYSKINTNSLSRLEIHPEGLWDKVTTLGFTLHLGLGQGSSINESTDSKMIIKTITLDEFVANNNVPKIDLIKMDIEDAELKAIKGGLNTIKKDRPQLAICIYHSLEQFIEIPLFLKNTLDDYSYYLSHYSWNKTETILYAIPNELRK